MTMTASTDLTELPLHNARSEATASRRLVLLGAVGAAVTLPSGGARAARPSRKPKRNSKMSTTPTIVLVHGFWGGAAHWSKVIVRLTAAGHGSIHAVEMPLTSLADDVERTRKMVAQVKGPVLLVGHSYGGAVITGAGTAPNVVGLVYVAAFAPDSGEALGDLMQAAPPPAGAANVAPDSDGYVWINPAKFGESFCQDLPADEQLVMAVTQKAPLGSVFGDKAGPAGWRTKPSWYQVSTEDRMINPENQKRMAARLEAKKIITLATGHASLASKPAEVAALIDEAAHATAA
jgi:pimeloyl-ACP methyl ester carboxylesterase